MVILARLATIPGIVVITATAMVATVVDASAFKSGRHFAAWIGLVPQRNRTGGKVHLGRISKKGEPYLRACSCSELRLWSAMPATSRILRDG